MKVDGRGVSSRRQHRGELKKPRRWKHCRALLALLARNAIHRGAGEEITAGNRLFAGCAGAHGADLSGDVAGLAKHPACGARDSLHYQPTIAVSVRLWSHSDSGHSEHTSNLLLL